MDEALRSELQKQGVFTTTLEDLFMRIVRERTGNGQAKPPVGSPN